MKSLPDSDKQTFRALFETMNAIKKVEFVISGDRTIRYLGTRRPHRASIYNAVVLWLAEQPEETQRDVIREGMKRVNQVMDGMPDADLEIGKQSVKASNPKGRTKKQA